MTGYEPPNHTQTPNAFFDKILPRIETVSELKVTLAVIRQTHGWHREEDTLSLSRLQELTGLRREAVVDGVRRALSRGSITRRKVGNTFAYRLKVVGKPDQQTETASRQTGPETVGKPDQLLVGKPDPQKKDRKKDKENSAKAALGNAEPPPEDDAKKVEGWEYAEMMRHDLKDSDVPLTRSRERRYVREFNEMLRKGIEPIDLDEAYDRVVSEWERVQLTVEQALRDLRTGKQANGRKPEEAVRRLQAVPSAMASPPEAVRAIAEHEDLRDYTPVLERWDFTRDEAPPWKVRADLGGNEEEQWRNLARIRSVVGRAAPTLEATRG